MKKTVATLIITVALASIAGAHCQIPCGIYDDHARIAMMEENVATIEKSMTEIAKLPADSPKNINQLVRWVSNKDEYADKLTEIVTYYFMAQRIKPDSANYEAKLKALHGMMISAMKCKQTIDLKNIEDLKALIHQFEALYFVEPSAAPQVR
jgi:nickel superoxide dismutase